MPVYMVRAGEHGPVKIGYADNVERRLTKMQADNHERLTVIREFIGGILEEAILHAKFAELHLHGEWFAFSKAMLGDLGLQEVIPQQPEVLPEAPAAPPATLSDDDADFGGWFRDNRLALGLTQQQMADRLGVARTTLASVETGADLPGRRMIIGLLRLIGVRVEAFAA